MPITLIADDLTGACDAGALFAGRRRVVVFAGEMLPDLESDVAVVDTESRALDPTAAAERVSSRVRCLRDRLAAGTVFKKIDSTLRGPVGAEIEALLSTTGRRSALICPAFPNQRRVVRDGVLLVDGVPVHESPVARDPAYAGTTSKVADIVTRGCARPVSSLPLARVRGDREELVRTLRALPDHLIVADGEIDADLDALASAALAYPRLVLAGSAGLARAVAASHGCGLSHVPLPRGRAWLIVAGSIHPATRAQLCALEAAGIGGLRLTDRDPDPHSLIAELQAGRPVFIATRDDVATGPGARVEAATRLASFAATLLEKSQPDLVAVTGGETAISLLRALGADTIELRGVPGSGLALGDIVSHGSSVLPLVTKAGGFGGADLFLTLVGGS